MVETARTIRWQVCDEVAASHTLLPHELVHHWWLWPHIDVQMLKDRPQHTQTQHMHINLYREGRGEVGLSMSPWKCGGDVGLVNNSFLK